MKIHCKQFKKFGGRHMLPDHSPNREVIIIGMGRELGFRGPHDFHHFGKHDSPKMRFKDHGFHKHHFLKRRFHKRGFGFTKKHDHCGSWKRHEHDQKKKHKHGFHWMFAEHDCDDVENSQATDDQQGETGTPTAGATQGDGPGFPNRKAWWSKKHYKHHKREHGYFWMMAQHGCHDIGDNQDPNAQQGQTEEAATASGPQSDEPEFPSRKAWWSKKHDKHHHGKHKYGHGCYWMLAHHGCHDVEDNQNPDAAAANPTEGEGSCFPGKKTCGSKKHFKHKHGKKKHGYGCYWMFAQRGFHDVENNRGNVARQGQDEMPPANGAESEPAKEAENGAPMEPAKETENEAQMETAKQAENEAQSEPSTSME